jgi:excisionase family DNA binding protein
MEDRWLSVDEIREYLGVKRDTIYGWISKNKMPAHKIGRLWKFKKDEVDEWLRSKVLVLLMTVWITKNNMIFDSGDIKCLG